MQVEKSTSNTLVDLCKLPPSERVKLISELLSDIIIRDNTDKFLKDIRVFKKFADYIPTFESELMYRSLMVAKEEYLVLLNQCYDVIKKYPEEKFIVVIDRTIYIDGADCEWNLLYPVKVIHSDYSSDELKRIKLIDDKIGAVRMIFRNRGSTYYHDDFIRKVPANATTLSVEGMMHAMRF